MKKHDSDDSAVVSKKQCFDISEKVQNLWKQIIIDFRLGWVKIFSQQSLIWSNAQKVLFR